MLSIDRVRDDRPWPRWRISGAASASSQVIRAGRSRTRNRTATHSRERATLPRMIGPTGRNAARACHESGVNPVSVSKAQQGDQLIYGRWASDHAFDGCRVLLDRDRGAYCIVYCAGALRPPFVVGREQRSQLHRLQRRSSPHRPRWSKLASYSPQSSEGIGAVSALTGNGSRAFVVALPFGAAHNSQPST